MPWRQVHAGDYPFSRLRNRIWVAPHTQCAKQRDRSIQNRLGLGPVAHDAIEGSEPDIALVIAEKELGVPRWKTARGGEVAQGCGLRIQSVYATPPSHVNPPTVILNKREDVLA